jgi:hypothetical protein
MPIESAPKKQQLPPNFVPPGGVPYPVKDGDTWKTVASNNGLDASKLVYFNYHTNNPDEVNWYLRRNAGCTKATPDGKNYVFSTSKPPKYIYLYPRNLSFNAEEVTGDPGGRNSLARVLDDHADDYSGEGAHYIAFTLDLFEAVHIGLAAIGIAEFVAVGMEVAAPFLAEAAVFLAIGAEYQDAINSLKRDQFRSGFSEGVVLGANRAKPVFIKNAHFWLENPVYNSVFPEEGKNLQNAHNLGLLAGYKYADQLNAPERVTLFHELNASMSPLRQNPEVQYGPDYWSKFSEFDRKMYYEDAAATFAANHMPR